MERASNGVAAALRVAEAGIHGAA